MCGVFGFLAQRGERVDLRRLQRIAQATERRGPHAFGLAWIDRRGHLQMFKQCGRISDHLGILKLVADAPLLIGHCRLATHGDARNNLNNHPHPCSGGWFVHNGVIGEELALTRAYALPRVTECDSEVLGRLIEQFDGTLLRRCTDAAELTRGNLVLLGLWTRPRRLVAVRRGNPLCCAASDEGVYLASLPDELPVGARHVRDDTAREYTFDRKGVIHVRVCATATVTGDQFPGDDGASRLAAGHCIGGRHRPGRTRAAGAGLLF